MTFRRIRRSLLVAAVAALASGPAAHADGLPVLGVDVGSVGVPAPSGLSHFVTIRAARNTLVARVSTTTGDVLVTRLLHGTFTIPAVAYDGSASGLSHDGRTLVLIEPRRAFPRAGTTLLVLDTRALVPLRLVRLHGDFSFDAISPTGRWIYLVQYVSPFDPTRYLVRALDATTGRLARRNVVDPSAPREKMRGNPLTRATSSDGRWAYTLYDGAGGTPFVHALDTSARTARCIDLDALTGVADLGSLRLRVDRRGHALVVAHGRTTVAFVDLRTFTTTRGPAAGSHLSGPVAIAAFALVCALAAAGFALWARRAAGRAATGLPNGRAIQDDAT